MVSVPFISHKSNSFVCYTYVDIDFYMHIKIACIVIHFDLIFNEKC